MNYSVFDIECDSLIENATKIHCLSVKQYRDNNINKFTLIDYEDMISFLENESVLVGHKIRTFDVPIIEEILGINIKAKLIDTLGLSWYLYPDRHVHGLEEWGDQFGIEKPIIKDWSNLTIEEYIFRCEKDVEINDELFNYQKKYLLEIYGDADKAMRLIGYLDFKLDCAREQEKVKWKVDIEKTKSSLLFLEGEQSNRVKILEQIMPNVTLYKVRSRPKILYKKDGSLSEHGKAWFKLLEEFQLPEYHIGALKIPDKQELGNPNSHEQVKDWLFSLGWTPITYKYAKQKDGTIKKIPQISDEGEICESVQDLYDIIPELVHLEGLYVIQHRIGLLKGFLRDVDSKGYIKAEIKGFANTLRFQHKTVVNLPTVGKPYGDIVRGCLIAEEGYILCGSDMSGLEDKTKRHYMYYYDPEYVKEMENPDFDPHLDIGLQSGIVTQEEVDFYKRYDKEKDRLKKEFRPSAEDKARFADIKERRIRCKRVNFSGIYGAGPPKIALTARMPLDLARNLHTVYWKRNWSVKAIAVATIHKTIGKQMWLLNPVSQLWYSLRQEKDKFSTLNQGTGVYCFDTWIRHIRNRRVKLCGQFHDECISQIPIGDQDIMREVLLDSIKDTNDDLKLNVYIGISIDFGHSYADIH